MPIDDFVKIEEQKYLAITWSMLYQYNEFAELEANFAFFVVVKQTAAAKHGHRDYGSVINPSVAPPAHIKPSKMLDCILAALEHIIAAKYCFIDPQIAHRTR